MGDPHQERGDKTLEKPVELIPLFCVRCSTPLPAQPDEVAWVCAQCGQGLLLDEDHGLEKLEVHFSTAIPPNAAGKPFWVAEGTVTLTRETYDSRGSRNNDALAFWAGTRLFFVPAFATNLEQLLSIGASLVKNPPVLESADERIAAGTRFDPVVLPMQDVRSAADFIVVAIEAERKDKLKVIEHTLELSYPVLWILPG